MSALAAFNFSMMPKVRTLKAKLPMPATDAVLRICATGVSTTKRLALATLPAIKLNTPLRTRKSAEFERFSA
jgi:hypothetical protein